ncbi:MAG: radical SAM protein [Candidatus Nitrohelix vancouverensis]|uniref:Radical SAM protein n=1 Tax=Candidatus Nitrohelix vancouverensis TaxID=2705534 RepID=A0A7T0C575_9BACT|nr:MAG: radical SAM protein [Candidatus Nitrohelix vancouverensis]
MRFSPRYAFPPLHAYFEVTYRCNLRCDMCHYLEIIEDTESNRKYKEERSAEQVCRTIDALPRLAAITFTGGEAIMKHDFQEIFDHACRKNKVHIITNGTLLTDTVIKNLLQNRLKSIWGSGLFFIGVSLEGGEALHDEITQVPGSYRKTLRGLEALIRERNALNSRFPKVHITCVIGNNNVRDLVPLYEYAESLGVEVCNFVLNNTATYWHGKDYDQDDHLSQPTAPVEPIEPQLLREQLDLLEAKSRGFNCQLRFSPNDITPEEIVRYYSNESSYKDYRCHISWSKVAFSAYGDVHSCPHYRLGSFDDGPRGYLWNEERSKKFRERVMKEKIFPGCLGCCQSEYVGPGK